MSAEQSASNILTKFGDSFNGLDQATLEAFRGLMLPELKALIEQVRHQLSLPGAEAQLKGPKRVTNYTLFGIDWRKDHASEKEDVFRKIAEAWKKASKKTKEEYRKKAEEANEAEKAKYIEEHGSLPSKGKRRLKPKRTNSFQVFTDEFRASHPDVGHRDVYKQAGAAWAEVNDADKEKYRARAEKMNDDYRKEFEEEQKVNPLPPHLAGKVKREKKLKPATKSGYILFGTDWRKSKNKTNLVGKEAMKAIGTAWNGLTDAQRKKYNKQAEKTNADIVKAFMEANPEADWTVSHQTQVEA